MLTFVFLLIGITAGGDVQRLNIYGTNAECLQAVSVAQGNYVRKVNVFCVKMKVAKL